MSLATCNSDNLNQFSNSNLDFFAYWDELGFFDDLTLNLPPNFFLIFEIARYLFTEETSKESLAAINDLTSREKTEEVERIENIRVNRADKIAPLSDRMEISPFRSISDLKKALPRELALDQNMFEMKLLTKSLMVQRFYESAEDKFKPISPLTDETGESKNKFEQKIYLLLDRSRSMDLKMRSFYSKCLVVEFLKKKINSRAKLYFRAFDSKVSDLFKIEKKEDFPRLIEKVFLTTTGGTSTNLQKAVFQAVNDIIYEQDPLETEILVVTDGASQIDKKKLQAKLGNIKLNILKIGEELPTIDFYDLKSIFDEEKIDFDFSKVNFKEVKNQLQEQKGKTGIGDLPEKRGFQIISDKVDEIESDLKEVATKYIQISDLNASKFEILDREKISYLASLINRLEKTDFKSLDPSAKKKFYKQIYFLNQYLQLFVASDPKENLVLKELLLTLNLLKEQIFKDAEFLLTIREVEKFSEDKKTLKLAKKERKKLAKQLQINSKNFDLENIDKAQFMFAMNAGKGGLGKFILLLLKMFRLFLKRFLPQGSKK